jgi:hypothetical protein
MEAPMIDIQDDDEESEATDQCAVDCIAEYLAQLCEAEGACELGGDFRSLARSAAALYGRDLPSGDLLDSMQRCPVGPLAQHLAHLCEIEGRTAPGWLALAPEFRRLATRAGR